jgi:hypothetical protein
MMFLVVHSRCYYLRCVCCYMTIFTLMPAQRVRQRQSGLIRNSHKTMINLQAICLKLRKPLHSGVVHFQVGDAQPPGIVERLVQN